MKTILVKLGLIASCVVLTACGTSPTVTQKKYVPEWTKVDATPYERQTIISRCKYEIGMNSSVVENSPKARDLFNQCMQKEGFRYQ